MRFYLTYKDHGLYDPVVDDTEVIYIPVDPEELEAVHIQTNVHETQQKTEVIDLNQSGRQLRPASKLVPVPLVKEFLKDLDIEDLPLLINVDDIPAEGKFRLPVSENYDPEGIRAKLDKYKGKATVQFQVKNIIDEANEERIRLQQAQDAVSEYITESKTNQNQKINEVSFETDRVIDVNVVRDSALKVTTASINRGTSLAQDVNENIKTEFKTLENREELITGELSKSFEENVRSESIRKESIKSLDSAVKVFEEIKKFENIDSQITESNIEERKLLRKQEIDEAIQSGTISRTLEMLNKDNTEISKPHCFEINKEYVSISKERDESSQKDSSAKQRAFSIGLQTIPHIRQNINSVNSDCRINLLTTFFLQLTNIMVTLSRFIATEPKTYLDQDSYSHRPKQNGLEKKYESTRLNKNNEQTFKNEQQEEGQGLSKYKYEHISNYSEGDLIRKGKLSGAKIAQIEGRKTTELTDKMDTVISEFQKKTGFEGQSQDQNFQSRSQSHSKMKREKETFYSESQKQSHSDNRKEYEEFFETKTQSFDIREMKSEKQTFETKTTETEAKPYSYGTSAPDDDNLFYVAIVEAHVYTNKDAIFEEQMKRERELKSKNIEKTKTETIQDIRKLSLADSITIPQTEEISLNEIEDKVIHIEKGVTGIEQSTIKIAAKKISEVLEPLVDLVSDISYSVKQAHTIEEPLRSVVQSTDVSTQEFEQHFEAKTVLSQKIYPSMEKPTKSVVEITEITTDENESHDLDVLKFVIAKPKYTIEDAKATAETIELSIKKDELTILHDSKPHVKKPVQVVEKMEKSVAETTEVVTGSNIDMLITPEVLVKTSRTAVEDAFKATAETFTILPEECKIDFVEGNKIKEESATVIVDEKMLSENFEVSLIEQREKPFEEKIVKIEQPTLLLEESVFSVAQKSSVSPIEAKSDIEIFAKVEQTANIKFDELKAIENTIINLEEPTNTIFETPEVIEKCPIRTMEDAYLITAEVLTILPDEPKDENFEVSKITECKSSIDIVEIKAAETIVTLPEEPTYEHLEVLRIEEKIPEIKFEETSFKVAEIISMLPEEPKDQFNLPQLATQRAGITMIEFKAAEATIVEAEEPQQPELNIKQPKETKSKQIIEPSNLHVAEVFATTTAESSKLIPKMEIQNQLAHIRIEEHKAIETTEVALGDLTYNKLTTLAPNTKHLETSIEESIQSVAQTTEVHLNEAESKIAISSKVITQAKASTAIEELKTTKTVKSEEVVRSISPTLPSSPITPDVEEYVFSLEAELEHPYVVEEAVSGEASLRIKSQRKEIQNADTSYTLAIESVVEANSETREEIEEIEKIHLSKEVLESMYEGYENNKLNMSANIDIKSLKANKVMSTEAHSLDVQHKLSVTKHTTMQDAINITLKETNQNVSTAIVNLDNYEMSSEKAAVEAKSTSSQSSLHKFRKVKSNDSQNSSLQKLESVKCMQSESLEAGKKSELSEYSEASNKELSISTSKSMESTVMESNIGLETNLHLCSGYKEAASKSVKSNSVAVIQSASQHSSQVTKGESNAVLKDEKLTLRTDLKDTRSNGSAISSTPLEPPTPLTDEYIFRLQTELPEESTFIPRDCSISPESTHEDVVINGLLTNYKTKIEERILYSPPLPTPPTSPEKTKPVYTKPGLKGGSGLSTPELTKEEIHDSRLVSAIDRTLKQIEEYRASVGLTTKEMSYHKEDIDKEFVPIHIVEEWLDNEADPNKEHNSPEGVDAIKITVVTEANNAGETAVTVTTESNMDDNDLEIQEISSNFDVIPLETEHDIVFNEKICSEVNVDDFKTIQINDNLEVEEDEYEFVAVHPSNLNKTTADDGSVTTNQFKSESLHKNTKEAQTLSTDKSQDLIMQHDQEIIGEESIIPPVESLKNSEVIKLLNEERTAVEERKWTTFLQKKYTPPRKTEVVYYGDFDIKTQFIPDAYKVKIVKQPKPKIAPDWKTQELKKESSPIIEISEPQPTEETEIEENNIHEQDNNLIDQEYTISYQKDFNIEQENNIIEQEYNIIEHEDKTTEEKSEIELILDPIDKESEELELQEMAQRNLAEELVKNVENMIDVNAPTEQQLEQMRDQLAALAQLPSVIQQTVELVNKRINLISQKEQQKKKEEEEYKRQEEEHRRKEEEHRRQDEEERAELERANQTLEMRVRKTEEAIEFIKKEEIKKLLEVKMKQEKRQKKENMEQMKIDQESRQVTQRSTLRMGQPMPLFGKLQERPVVLPGGRKWRTPEDVYDEELINESLVGQAEVIKGTAIGVNFRKFEKPPPPLDHLKHSEVFKAIHEVEQPVKRVELLGAVLAEADYIERARSMSPCVEKVAESIRKNP